MRKLYTVVLTFILLLSTTTSVEALESKTIDRHNGASAYAEWYEINNDAITYTYLSVIETNDGTDIYISTCTYGPDYWSEKWGYMFTENDVFEIDKKLNSASLSEVKIDVNNWDTGETDTLTVKANWIGIGNTSKGSSSYSSRNGDYVWKSSDSSTSRGASATGSLDGLGLETSSYASICNFKSAYMSLEK